jgi:hypothetical protein
MEVTVADVAMFHGNGIADAMDGMCGHSKNEVRRLASSG